jgi:hypothetical protein
VGLPAPDRECGSHSLFPGQTSKSYHHLWILPEWNMSAHSSENTKFPKNFRFFLWCPRMPRLTHETGVQRGRVQEKQVRAPQHGTCRAWTWTDRWLHRRNRTLHHAYRSFHGWLWTTNQTPLASAARSHTSLAFGGQSAAQIYPAATKSPCFAAASCNLSTLPQAGDLLADHPRQPELLA